MSESANLREFYAWFADCYAMLYGWRPKGLVHRWRFLLPFLKENGVRRILDAACGIGRYTLELARLGFQTTGVDLSQHMIAVAGSE